MKVLVRITQVIILVAFVVGWYMITLYNMVSRFVIPNPVLVASTFVGLFEGTKWWFGTIYPQLGITLFEIAGAVALAVGVGLPLGFVIGMKRTVGDIYEPFVYLLYSIPGIILYPIIYIMVGTGPPSKILFGAFIAAWVFTINVIAGLRQVKPQYFRLARTLKLSSVTTMFKIVLPAAAPNIVSGLRQAVALSMLAVIGGQILASSAGIGFVLSGAMTESEIPLMYALIVLTFIIGFSLIEIMRLIEKRFLAHAA